MKAKRSLATVLFTDIVGSTERAAELGDHAWRELLSRHDECVRRELGRHLGFEINTAGDSFVARFRNPDRAIVCAWAIRDALRGLGLEIRGGLHMGQVEEKGGAVGGIAVHIGARVAAEGGPGEILVSRSVRDSVEGAGFAFEDTGVHPLKGVPGEWRLFRLRAVPGEAVGALPGWRQRLSHQARQRAGTLAIALAALVGLAGVSVLVQERALFRPGAATAKTAGLGVAVLPFRVAGTEEALWREGMVDLLATNLEDVPGLRKIDPRAVLSHWREAKEPSEPEAVLEIARDLGARYALTGSMVGSVKEVRLTAQLYDVETGALEGTAAVDGPPDSLLALVDRLSVEILRSGLVTRSGDPLQIDLSRVTTASLPALKSYLEGEQRYRRSRFTEAFDYFQRAAEIDSTFAWPLYRLSLAYTYEGDTKLALEYAERAARLADRLPEREALLLKGNAELQQGRPAAIQTLQTLTRRYPDDVEGWCALGVAYFELGGQVLQPRDAYRKAFRHAIDLSRYFGPAYIYLLNDGFARRDSVGLRSLIAGYRQIDSETDICIGVEVAYKLLWGNAATKRQTISALDTIPPDPLTCATYWLSLSPEYWENVERAYAAWSRSTSPKSPNRDARRFYLMALAERGRIREARSLLAEAVLEEGDRVLWARWTLYLELEGYPDSVAALEATAVLATQPDPWDRFLLGAYAADQGRWGDAEREIAGLDAAARESAARRDSLGATGRTAFARALKGYVALRRGDRRTAIRDLDFALPALPGMGPDLIRSDIHNLLRFEYGKLTLEIGEPRDAQRYLTSFNPFLDSGLRTPLEFYLARTAEALGDRRAAAFHYAHFVDWWQDADPELQPWREEARRALTRLMAES